MKSRLSVIETNDRLTWHLSHIQSHWKEAISASHYLLNLLSMNGGSVCVSIGQPQTNHNRRQKKEKRKKSLKHKKGS